VLYQRRYREIEEVRKCYDEQEQVDRDDFISKPLAEIDSEDSDSNSDPDYDGEDDGGAAVDSEEDWEEVHEGDAPQEQEPQPEPKEELKEVPEEEHVALGAQAAD
jgi:hypothetical protein